MTEELTEREKEILALVGRGLDNRAIAQELGIRYQTVLNATSIIYSRLRVPEPRRVNATLWALRNGLIGLEVGKDMGGNGKGAKSGASDNTNP